LAIGQELFKQKLLSPCQLPRENGLQEFFCDGSGSKRLLIQLMENHGKLTQRCTNMITPFDTNGGITAAFIATVKSIHQQQRQFLSPAPQHGVSTLEMETKVCRSQMHLRTKLTVQRQAHAVVSTAQHLKQCSL